MSRDPKDVMRWLARAVAKKRVEIWLSEGRAPRTTEALDRVETRGGKVCLEMHALKMRILRNAYERRTKGTSR